ncbi:hypothetical protein PR048_009453 [Dryococelus australis]|uniref:Uncharacterized protein n=1 Tax=Dryococelus australis TaxID=614101 RepID=A0ABQ9HZX9_9NEOP|nr:hypothetical protein PR048_009453 [Dryococelus australis]
MDVKSLKITNKCWELNRGLMGHGILGLHGLSLGEFGGQSRSVRAISGLSHFLPRLHSAASQPQSRGPRRCSGQTVYLPLRRKPGSIPCRVAPGLSQVRIVLYAAAGRWFFSGISRFPHFFIPVPLHTHLTSSSSVLKTSMLRVAQYSLTSVTTPTMRDPSLTENQNKHLYIQGMVRCQFRLPGEAWTLLYLKIPSLTHGVGITRAEDEGVSILQWVPNHMLPISVFSVQKISSQAKGRLGASPSRLSRQTSRLPPRPTGFGPWFFTCGNRADGAAGWRVFSEISRFHPPCIPSWRWVLMTPARRISDSKPEEQEL